MAGMAVFLIVFIAVCVLGFFIVVRAVGDKRRAISRLRELAAEADAQANPDKKQPWTLLAVPKLAALVTSNEKIRIVNLRTRLLHAGYFSPSAPLYFVGMQLLIMAGLALVCALAPLWMGWLAWQQIPLLIS